MESLYKLRDMLCEELEEITEKGELSAGSLETVHKLTDTIKNIDKIVMLEEEEGGYSEEGGKWMARGSYSGGRSERSGNSRAGGSYRGGSYESGESYEGGGSYANRGKHYVRGHYSRAEGREQLMQKMDGLMRSAGTEREREIIRRMMGELENV